MAPTGELYISDEENEQVLIVTSFGELERSFGGFTSAADRLRTPAGLTIGRGSAVFVADTGNDRIARYDAFGSFLGSIGQGLLEGPKGVATDGQGYLYVADTGHDRICIFSSQGELLFSLGAAGTGYGSFHLPIDLAVSGTDLLCVLDSGNGRVQIFQIVRRAETEGL
jgi:DNA-binding beta-propeller fold protein YncE